MCVPLRDQSGKVRYYLGAQLDITSLVNDCTGLASLKTIVERNNDHRSQVTKGDVPTEAVQRDEFEQLSEAFNPQELEKVISLRRHRQLHSLEGFIYKDSSEKRLRRLDSPPRQAIPDLDSSFQLNGEGSAPPLGYYKTVSTSLGPNIGVLANAYSIFWFDLIHHSVYCLPHLICEYLGSCSRPY